MTISSSGGSAPASRALASSLGYCANSLVRGGETRAAAALDAALAHPEAVFYLMRDGRWLCRPGTPPLDVGFRLDDALRLQGEPASVTLLGWSQGDERPHLALALPASETEIAGTEWHDLRSLALHGRVDRDVEGRLAQAAHFLGWHQRTRYCGRCGAPTQAEAGGYRRRCTVCAEVHFPRTDPVVIMLVHDAAGRCVLGRQRHFAPGMWSCLAGFVEPGETIEDAVRRETLEEAGLVVDRVEYRASQPWPFPGSLMIGCLARTKGDAIIVQDLELEDCRWFERREVALMLAGTHPASLTTPAPFAIAHHLIHAFAQDEGTA